MTWTSDCYRTRRKLKRKNLKSFLVSSLEFPFQVSCSVFIISFLVHSFFQRKAFVIFFEFWFLSFALKCLISSTLSYITIIHKEWKAFLREMAMTQKGLSCIMNIRDLQRRERLEIVIEEQESRDSPFRNESSIRYFCVKCSRNFDRESTVLSMQHNLLKQQDNHHFEAIIIMISTSCVNQSRKYSDKWFQDYLIWSVFTIMTQATLPSPRTLLENSRNPRHDGKHKQNNKDMKHKHMTQT